MPELSEIKIWPIHKKPAIETTVPSEPIKALQIEDIEHVIHESIFHPMQAISDLVREANRTNALLDEIVKDNLIKRQVHDDWSNIGLTLNYKLSYHRHTFVYCYSNTGFTLQVSNGATQIVPANYWTLVNYPEGVYLTVLGGSDTVPLLVQFRACDVPLEPGTQMSTLASASYLDVPTNSANVVVKNGVTTYYGAKVTTLGTAACIIQDGNNIIDAIPASSAVGYQSSVPLNGVSCSTNITVIGNAANPVVTVYFI